MSGDTTQEHCNDGLALNIMTQLSTLPGLFLVGVDSMFTYKSTGVTPLQAARAPGVRNVLQGTVRKPADRVRAPFEEVFRLEPESSFGYVEAAWSLCFEVDVGWSNDPLHERHENNAED